MAARHVVSALALILLAPLALPAASASDHCVIRDRQGGGFVCYGQEWCDEGGCARPVCVDDTMRVCVLDSPDAGPEGCVLTPTSELGLVCYGQRWCDAGMCATPICLTDDRKVCVLTS